MTNALENFNYYVILVSPQIEGNIGAIARLCNNYNVNKLVLIAPQADYLSDETRARAKHAINYLEEAEVYPSLDAIRDKFDFLIATSAKAGEKYNVYRQPIFPWQLKEIATTSAKIGLVFGREDQGLLNEELRKCDFVVNIPIPGNHKVLNLSHAVAIVLHEVWKLRSNIEEVKKERLSTNQERQLLFNEFSTIVDKLNYEEHRKPILKQTFKVLINRSFASHEEIHALIGLFKSIKKTINGSVEKNEAERY
ncbi:MAG: RNA methyltransferase [Candidatus Heimdallarchaeaceae archaeon]